MFIEKFLNKIDTLARPEKIYIIPTKEGFYFLFTNAMILFIGLVYNNNPILLYRVLYRTVLSNAVVWILLFYLYPSVHFIKKSTSVLIICLDMQADSLTSQISIKFNMIVIGINKFIFYHEDYRILNLKLVRFTP